jgi:hypothetical protein
LQKIKRLLRLAFSGVRGAEGRPGIQRLAIPHTFNDGLGFPEAALAVAQVFLRILLSCLLFAVWAMLALWLWNAMGGHFWRWLVLVPMLASFLSSFVASFVAMMAAISLLTRRIVPKRAS